MELSANEGEIFNKKSVHNVSSLLLTKDQVNILEKGLKFGIASKNVDEFEMLTRFEIVAQQINRQAKNSPDIIDITDENEHKKELPNLNLSVLHQFQGLAFEFLQLAKKKDNNITENQQKALPS